MKGHKCSQLSWSGGLTGWSPQALLSVIQSQHKAKAPQKERDSTAGDSIAPQGLSISAFPMENPPKSHSMAAPALGPFGEDARAGRAKPHLSSSFLWEGEESQGPCGQGSCWYLLEALVEMEGGVSPSCCPCAPHQAELAGNVGLSLPAQGHRLCCGHRAVLQGNDCSQLPALPAPPVLPAHVRTFSACLHPGESLGCSGGHPRQNNSRNKTT